VFLVPLFWALTKFGTPGCIAAAIVISMRPPSFLGNADLALMVAAIVDFVVWFAAIWGLQTFRCYGNNSRMSEREAPRYTDPTLQGISALRLARCSVQSRRRFTSLYGSNMAVFKGQCHCP
jgi:hypothetical protein